VFLAERVSNPFYKSAKQKKSLSGKAGNKGFEDTLYFSLLTSHFSLK